ncbi:hypothetical protein [Paenibacillus sp. IITD108]|uniref:hypothetical protein n=1 Tax=Paenibacillus sp. IITD108 TaxID=3116649 RepID=UPI002F3F9FDD
MENQIEDYSLHINTDEDEKELFDGIQWDEEDGAKIVGFWQTKAVGPPIRRQSPL